MKAFQTSHRRLPFTFLTRMSLDRGLFTTTLLPTTYHYTHHRGTLTLDGGQSYLVLHFDREEKSRTDRHNEHAKPKSIVFFPPRNTQYGHQHGIRKLPLLFFHSFLSLILCVFFSFFVFPFFLFLYFSIFPTFCFLFSASPLPQHSRDMDMKQRS